jgi:hypothetical protein
MFLEAFIAKIRDKKRKEKTFMEIVGSFDIRNISKY